jgi:hypothetical protein
MGVRLKKMPRGGKAKAKVDVAALNQLIDKLAGG